MAQRIHVFLCVLVGLGHATRITELSWKTSWDRRIPAILHMTGEQETIAELPDAIRANVERTRALNPDFELRYLGTQACADYIEANYDEELLKDFKEEPLGSKRGDICRVALLLKDGGFYLDLDVQLNVPIKDFCDASTTFFTARGHNYQSTDFELLSGFMGAAPANPIVAGALTHLKLWEAGQDIDPRGADYHLGPITLGRAFTDFTKAQCPQAGAEVQWVCGDEVLRIYEEKVIKCQPRSPENALECPEKRAASTFGGGKYGFFRPGEQRELVAWARFEDCVAWGCATGGIDRHAALSLVEANTTSGA